MCNYFLKLAIIVILINTKNSFFAVSSVTLPSTRPECLPGQCQKPKFIRKSHFEQAPIEIGSEQVQLTCEFDGDPKPSVLWTLPCGRQIASNATIGATNRFHIDANDSLIIANVSRYDSGPYRCQATNPYGNTSSYIALVLDPRSLYTTKFQHDCFASAFILAFLTVMFCIKTAIFLVRRYCLHQKQYPRNKQVYTMLETIENYKSQQLIRLRDNYQQQISRIKDNGIQQLEWLQHSYQTQVKHVKEFRTFGTNQIASLRNQYFDQVKRVRDYSTSQMNVIRENYVYQRNKVRKFSSHQIVRIRESYKVQQLNLNKAINNLSNFNFETCRQMDDDSEDSELVRLSPLATATATFVYRYGRDYDADSAKTSIYFTPKELSAIGLDDLRNDNDETDYHDNLRDFDTICDHVRSSINELKITNSLECLGTVSEVLKHRRTCSLPDWVFKKLEIIS